MTLSIAIPDSSLKDETTQVNKTRKISIIARACAIFRIQEIFIYKEKKHSENDSVLLSTLLKYLETPQYFRKQLFPKMNILKYAGVLYPLKIQNHLKNSNPKKIQVGDMRDAIVINYKGKKFVDIGINQLIPFFGKEESGTRIAAQIKTKYPKLSVKIIPRKEVNEYWGYKVKEGSNLFSLLTAWNGNIILTSRKGKILTKSHIKKYDILDKDTLVVFGSTEKGIHEILGNNIRKIQNVKTLNFFPNQATETIRLEEAILGTLSLLNFFNINHT